jgi:alcohol dehydrogenase, propanol-preferring
VPTPSPTGVLVKILASGGTSSTVLRREPLADTHPVCRSDHSLLTLEKQADWFQPKWTLGHEGCGRIVEFGSDVKDTTLKVVCTYLPLSQSC